MEAYDGEKKTKIETLMAKEYFRKYLKYQYKDYLKKYGITNYSDVYVGDITFHITTLTLDERLFGFGLMISIIFGVFTVSGTVIFFYNRTETHQKHLKLIADEFGFEDISEVSQVTHFKLF